MLVKPSQPTNLIKECIWAIRWLFYARIQLKGNCTKAHVKYLPNVLDNKNGMFALSDLYLRTSPILIDNNPCSSNLALWLWTMLLSSHFSSTIFAQSRESHESHHSTTDRNLTTVECTTAATAHKNTQRIKFHRIGTAYASASVCANVVIMLHTKIVSHGPWGPTTTTKTNCTPHFPHTA